MADETQRVYALVSSSEQELLDRWVDVVATSLQGRLSGSRASATSRAPSSRRGASAAWVSLGGVAGFRNPKIRTDEYAYPPGAVVVVHSDGVRARWSEADVRGLVERAPLLLAATMLRDAGIRHDDACVLVGRAAS